MNASSALDGFDRLAPMYDAFFESAYPVKVLRNAVRAMLRRRIPSGASILDINCGTGTDCLQLAREGYRVTGTDISPEMVAAARKKAAAARLPAEFRVCSFLELESLPEGKFDGVLSNFGGLNCADDLREVFVAVHLRLAEEGCFLAVVMPPFSLWEYLAGTFKRDRGYARRRRSGKALVAGVEIPVTYFSERDVRRAALGLFDTVGVRGFNIVSPPPNAGNFLIRHPRLTTALHRLERPISTIPVIRRGGDHIAVLMRKGGISRSPSGQDSA